MRDYERAAQAIRYLEAETEPSPRLGHLATHLGLSESHVQRLFTRWVGISPKRFVQHRAAEAGKRMLREGSSVLDATYRLGLSSAGRMHDLFVQAEAVTPGEYRSGGAGLRIEYGIHESPFGRVLLGVTTRGVCALTFHDAGGDDGAVADLRSRWPAAEIAHAPSTTAPISDRIFSGRVVSGEAPLGLLLKGTNFQLRIWDALLRIPVGSLATYEDVAQAIGSPRATRAVGSAIAANPIALLIPCHRVIRKTGNFGGYRWGPERKAGILRTEAMIG